MEKEIIDYLYKLDWSNYYNIEVYNHLTKNVERYSKKLTSISYSNEEIDFYLQESNTEDFDKKFLSKLRANYEVENIKSTANIATQISRFDTLKLTLESIKNQFDEIRIYINDVEEENIPDFLRDYKVFCGPNLTDHAKLIWSDNENEYYFTLDDDIIYPPDYVEKTLPLIGDRIVCYSGKKINTSSLDTYFTNHRNYELFQSLDEEEDIDIVDTSSMAFNTNYFYCNLWRAPINFMSDLVVSLEAALHKVPTVCLPHESNWIKIIYRDGIRKSFLDEEQEYVKMMNMISTFKDLKKTNLSKKNIFGTLSKNSVEELSKKVKELGNEFKNLYHIGCGIGTNLLHMNFLLDFENYIGVNTEEYRTRFAKRTYHGKRKDFKGRVNFFRSDLEKLMFDSKSIILLNPHISQKIVSRIWNNIPVGCHIISFEKIIECSTYNSIEVELLSGEKKKLHFYKKISGITNKYKFNNIPYKFEELVNKNDKQIPKIVHHIAPSDKIDWHYKWEDCFLSWTEHFSDFEHIMWDNEDIEKLISEDYPWYLDIYNSYDRNIKRYDVARLLILYKYGGIYADMDYVVYKNFYELMSPDKVSTPESPFKLHEFVQNALFVSPKEHVFWMICLDESLNRTHLLSVLDATGPKLISDVYYEYLPICKNLVDVLPCEIYNPSWRTPEYKSEKLIAKHLCSNSWTLKVRPGVIWTDDFI